MTKKRLIDAEPIKKFIVDGLNNTDPKKAFGNDAIQILAEIEYAPTVDAVEVPDKKLLGAIKLLIKQYEHSRQSDYVHSPVAHALYHTWKQVDERRTDN